MLDSYLHVHLPTLKISCVEVFQSEHRIVQEITFPLNQKLFDLNSFLFFKNVQNLLIFEWALF